MQVMIRTTSGRAGLDPELAFQALSHSHFRAKYLGVGHQ